MNYGKVEEPSSSRRRYPSTARYAATSAILTAISSRSDRAPISPTVNARPGWDADLDACGTSLGAACWRERHNTARPQLTEKANLTKVNCTIRGMVRAHPRSEGARDGLETVGPVCAAG